MKQIHSTLNGKHGAIARFLSRHGDLECDFSLKSYKKELNELNKLGQKAKELIAIINRPLPSANSPITCAINAANGAAYTSCRQSPERMISS